MNHLNEQLFPPEFISDYIKNQTGKQRFLTYTLFRFLSAIGREVSDLPTRLKENLSFTFSPEDFPVLEAYLSEDYYFSPALCVDTNEPLYLYAAIRAINNADDVSFLENLVAALCPAAASFPPAASDLEFFALLQTEQDFYGSLFLAAADGEAALVQLLPYFMKAYQPAWHFSSEYFILFNFMDEYFEEKNCRQHPSFVKLVDTLVAATLNYHDTDFHALAQAELCHSRAGDNSRFAGIRLLGNMRFSSSPDADQGSRMLAKLFHYAAVYELRNNLFDFHLDEDRLITLENWKDKLHWHYVQYANVYNHALDSFHMALFSRELLKRQFEENLRQL